MATATKANIALRSPQGVIFAVEKFLTSMDWNGCGNNYRRGCVAHWTTLFATDEVVYTESIIQNFLSFIDHMSCSADSYVSLGGSITTNHLKLQECDAKSIDFQCFVLSSE